jgi:hypothetical protein
MFDHAANSSGYRQYMQNAYTDDMGPGVEKRADGLQAGESADSGIAQAPPPAPGAEAIYRRHAPRTKQSTAFDDLCNIKGLCAEIDPM